MKIKFEVQTSDNRIKIRGNIVHFTDITSLNRIMKSKYLRGRIQSKLSLSSFTSK